MSALGWMSFGSAEAEASHRLPAPRAGLAIRGGDWHTILSRGTWSKFFGSLLNVPLTANDGGTK